MTLVAQAAAAVTPLAKQVIDVGCGAGNYTLKLLEQIPNLDVTLIDLSQAMLDRALERIQPMTTGRVLCMQGDIREIALPAAGCDLILASAVLHHLRTDAEWQSVFGAFHDALRPAGSIWIFDLIESSLPVVQTLMWKRYGDYLTNFKGEAYRDEVYAYIQQEDTPRSLMFQLDLLRQVGFQDVEILHKNSCFAAFGAVKAASVKPL